MGYGLKARKLGEEVKRSINLKDQNWIGKIRDRFLHI